MVTNTPVGVLAAIVILPSCLDFPVIHRLLCQTSTRRDIDIAVSAIDRIGVGGVGASRGPERRRESRFGSAFDLAGRGYPIDPSTRMWAPEQQTSRQGAKPWKLQNLVIRKNITEELC